MICLAVVQTIKSNDKICMENTKLYFTGSELLRVQNQSAVLLFGLTIMHILA